MSYSKKHFNEKHEVIISTEMKPVKQSDTDGVVIPHKQVVNRIRHYDGYGSTNTEVSISKDFILDLAKQIEQLESVVEDLEQNENLPF